MSKLTALIALSLLLAISGCGRLAAEANTARSANDFLQSIGVCVHVQHHVPAEVLIEPLRYMGVRNVRDGADKNYDTSGLILLHEKAGVHVTFGPGSGADEASLLKTLKACRQLAAAGALLAVEGPNEPNNFGGVTYQGQNSQQTGSWLPVASYQMDLYHAVKNDPALEDYPVYGVSEVGAEEDNTGLQFLKIPEGANVLMPDGIPFADFLNCHNYVCGHIDGIIDNQATLAASVHPTVAIDHLYGNHGLTWRRKFKGYSESELATLPKVTTETGWKTDNTSEGDDRQGKMLLNVYLAQFKAGWKHTFVYEINDDADGGFGFYTQNMAPRKAAEYLHNLTTILADSGKGSPKGKVGYSIPNQPATVHDLLLQKSDGTFALAIWGEQVAGTNAITVELGGSRAALTVYDPTEGTSAVQTLKDADSMPLTIGDHVLILEFK